MFPFKSTLFNDPSLNAMIRNHPQVEYSKEVTDKDSKSTQWVFAHKLIKSTHPYSEYTTNSRVVIGENEAKNGGLIADAFDHFFDLDDKTNSVSSFANETSMSFE